jgi:hypothetical protein
LGPHPFRKNPAIPAGSVGLPEKPDRYGSAPRRGRTSGIPATLTA